MATIADLLIKLGVDPSGVDKGAGQAESRMTKLGSKMQSVGAGMSKMGKGLSLAVTAPILLAGKVAMDELNEIEAANATTAKAIERMGKSSLVSVSGVQELAGELQKMSGIDDQLIQGAQNMILNLGGLDTTTKQGARTFDAASLAIVNYAEATGKDAVGASQGLAKALNDPEKAAGKLAKMGVKLTDSQQKVITKMVEAGDKAGAQAKIVELLGKKFQGAANLTNADKFAVVKDQLAGVGAEILSTLMPSIQKVVTWVGKLTDRFNGLSPGTKKIVAIVLVLAAALGPVLIIVGSMVSAIGALIPVFAAVGAPVILIVAAIAGFIAILVHAYRTNEQFRNKVKSAMTQVKAAVSTFVNEAKATLKSLAEFWEAHGEQILDIVMKIFKPVAILVKQSMKNIMTAIRIVMAVIRGDWGKAWGLLKKMLSQSLKAVIAAVRASFGAFKAVFGLLGKAGLAAIKLAWTGLKKLGSWAMGLLADGLRGGLGAIVGAAKKVGGAIKDAIKDAINYIIDKWNDFELPSIKVKDKKLSPTIGTPNLPRFARGGIATTPSIFGDGPGAEAAVPLGNSVTETRDRQRVMREAGLAGAGGGGGDIHVNFYGDVYGDKKAITKMVLDGLRSSDASQRAYTPRRRF